MIISLRSDGTATMLEPSHIYQGSNIVNVYVIAPFPNTTALQVGFTLPNGTTASAPMTYVQDSENNLVVWQYTIAAAITNEAGAASVSITATTTTGQVIASQSIPFTIEATTLPVLPDVPTQDEYTLILQYLQQNSAKIATLQGQISAIEADVDTANENASAAVSTANAAQTTAQTALTTANGLAASIAQANTNASEALSTANQAASAAASNATAIANIVNGTTTVAKADSANSATNATNATNDGNGANIANTYATKTELSTGNADTLAAAQNYTNQALANYSIIEIVQTLPETGDTGKIYLVPKADSTSGDLYSEYLWNGTEWELVGTVSATSGTTIKVNGVSQIEVDFTSDPQTQIAANSTAISNIVDGTTTVPNATKATQDGNGNVIATTYATVTALGSETSARQSADTTLQNNINAIVNGTTPAGDSDKLGGVAAAGYARLSSGQTFTGNNNFTANIRKVLPSIGYFGAEFGFVDTRGNFKAGFGVFGNNETDTTVVSYAWIGNSSASPWLRINPDGSLVSPIPILQVDPTKLTPSTENGWTQGSLSTNISGFENGLYLVSCSSFTAGNTFVGKSVGVAVKNANGMMFTLPVGADAEINFSAIISTFTANYHIKTTTTLAEITAATLWFKKMN